MSDPIRELVQANRLGISITELRRRRAQAADQIASPAAEAFRKSLAASLAPKHKARIKLREELQ